ncbi:cation transporting ATPase [Trichoderma citrinoviride]|uniref:Calcium-transporting ATPase n=1 Tax=Trichoderma citrinoviride TaxID=58853 RepID=A0A2T4B7K0_9HYPO|nr:cation transporting ATPase [Trichoderma citrinoviride]PTB65191.1 cation transporting ATPase [Trichoderma citrinoviride]
MMTVCLTCPSPNDTSTYPSAATSSNTECNNGALPGELSRSEDIQQHSVSALRPDPGEEHLFETESSPFAFSPGQLGKLINPKSLAAFVALGGLAGLEKGLHSDRRAGLSVEEHHLLKPITFEEATSAASPVKPPGNCPPAQSNGKPSDSFAERKRIFGENRLPERKSKSFFQLAWIALHDHILILLSVAAIVSLALGLYQTFGQTKHEGAKVEWVEGVAIIVAIAVVVIVGALNDWQKERQFQKLNMKKEDRSVKVIRSGNPEAVSIYEVVVGDVMLLEPGDVVPVDGIFIEGHGLNCDESSATGESDLVRKIPAEEVLEALRQHEVHNLDKLDPFIISGARVLDGVGSFLVTSVGQNSSHGRTMMSLREDTGLTPLQSKLNILAGYIAKLGSAAGCLLFTVLLIEFLVRLPNNTDSAEEKGQDFLHILVMAITIIVVAVPEGLPLAVTLSLAFATKRMTRENNLVRHLQSCETMGNATIICSDKTGTLTENSMTVTSGALGGEVLLFGEGNSDLQSHIPHHQLSSKLDMGIQQLLKTAIAVNTTAFEREENGTSVFVGTKTETALLEWVRRHFGLGPVSVERANNPVIEMFPFISQRKCMGVVIRISESGGSRERSNDKYRLFVKGAPEIVLAQCTTSLMGLTSCANAEPLGESQKDAIRNVVSRFGTHALRTLALSYRDFHQWPPHKPQTDDTITSSSDDVTLPDVHQDMTWIGVVGIQDPVRPGVPAAVQDCRTASVSVKMVTGDNLETAKAVGLACGILRSSQEEGQQGLVMEGKQFRQLSPEQKASVARDICILARSSPEDKRILVEVLKNLGEIVAVTGDGTNDAPALKVADVGFSMGITGTEVAKEASDIILMDDNFASIVKALGWGRAVNDSVKKFLLFQLTVNITAVIITFVTAVSDNQETAVLNAVQLLWVNLIMDTFAALALATDPPTLSALQRKPEPRTASLISLSMWKMILGQSIYQLTVCFVLWFGGPGFFDYPEDQLRTLIFNVFVFMQIFKLINSRRIDNKLNIFEGLHRNWLFMLMMSIMVGGQIIIIYVGGDAFVVVRLTSEQWGISIGLGLGSIPIGVLVRLIPDAVLRSCSNKLRKKWPRWLRLPSKKAADGSDTSSIERYNAVFSHIRDDLAFLRMIRGGRIRALSESLAKPHESSSPHHHQVKVRRGSSPSSKDWPASPMFSAIGMPGIVAASIGGLSPLETRSSTV